MPRYASYVNDPLVEHNTFRAMAPDATSLPDGEAAMARLPDPFWEGHPEASACWRRAWEIALSNLRRPSAGSGFVASFIDTAFNGSLFMWDSSFITMFGRYGRRVFDFQRTLDNFYARQHPDGFICREIQEGTGEDAFDRFDPSATGPNLLPWAEWEHYRQTGDRARVEAVLPALLAYYRWFRKWRSWPDGTYWATGWACGMDNQPRMDPGYVAEHDHGHLCWVDTCLQQVLAARMLVDLNAVAGSPWPVQDIAEEIVTLGRLVNSRMWDQRAGFYMDRRRDGTLTGVKSIGAYWALLARLVPRARMPLFLGHLEDPAQFNRPHRVPSLSADHPLYRPGGDYWRGSVWAPATWMVLQGLRCVGQDRLAREIALNHLANVYAVFQSTGTLWENYAPESAAPGQQAARDFVGWTGLAPVAVLLEYAFGLRPDPVRGVLRWDVGLTEAHGVRRYPFGAGATVDLACAQRASAAEPPVIEASSDRPLLLDVRWEGGRRRLRVGA